MQHTFRVPEARPPSIVSLVFAAATAAPVLILLALVRRRRWACAATFARCSPD